MNNETMTLEELTSIFGADVAAQMYAQQQAASGGSSLRTPLPLIKKVSTHGSELGKFGDFVLGTEWDKNDAGDRVVTNKGTNLGTEFQMIITNIQYQYKKWDEAQSRTLRSTITDNLSNLNSLVDSFKGTPLPATKEARKAAGWKLVRVNSGLVRANPKAKWEAATFETDGMLYYTLGELLKSAPGQGFLSGIVSLKFTLASKGSTQFSVIDKEASSFGPLPKDLFKGELKPVISGITSDMAAYMSAVNDRATSSTPEAPKESVEEEELPEW